MFPHRVVFAGSILCLPLCFAAPPAFSANHVRDYLVNTIALPATSTQAFSDAFDLDGDGAAENQLGQVFAALLSTGGLDLPGMTQNAVSTGQVVHVLRLKSTDASFSSDAAAEADWYVGAPLLSSPFFDGLDTPTINAGIAPGIFHGGLLGGAFTSPPPATAPAPATLPLELLFGSQRFDLSLQGARLTFEPASAELVQGQINGAVPKNDIDTQFVPALAMGLESIVQADPTSSSAHGILQVFDIGCSPGDGFANDGHVEVCEVATSPFMQALLAPDVQLDGTGHYVNPPAVANAVSLGFRFTAVVRDRVFANGFDPAS